MISSQMKLQTNAGQQGFKAGFTGPVTKTWMPPVSQSHAR